jgi:hypothetical protein
LRRGLKVAQVVARDHVSPPDCALPTSAG